LTDGSPGNKPCDIYGSDNQGRLVAIEVKVKREGAIPITEEDFFKLLEVHQLNWLRLWNSVSARCIIMVFHTPTKQMRAYLLDTKMVYDIPRHKGLFVLPP
jgi:penicillin-binding protein-related factor A (putative recombinase)